MSNGRIAVFLNDASEGYLELSDLLCEMNRERKKQKEEGKSCFSEEKRQEHEKRYAAYLEKGIEENHSAKHKYAKKEEKTLLTRLEKYRENNLLFLKRFEVPFDNNMSERDVLYRKRISA